MTERKYSLTEIDQMREYFRSRLPQPSIFIECHMGGGEGTLSEQSRRLLESRNREAEEHLRTAMLAGVDPAECVPPSPEPIT